MEYSWDQHVCKERRRGSGQREMLNSDVVSMENSDYPWGALKPQCLSDLAQAGARWKANMSLDISRPGKGRITDKVSVYS